MSGSLLDGLKALLKLPSRPTPRVEKPLAIHHYTAAETEANIKRSTEELPFRLQEAKDRRALLVAQRGNKCSLYGYKLIRIERELYNQAEKEYMLRSEGDDITCGVWISPENFIKAQKNGWKMDVVIEDGQDEADQKLEYLIDNADDEIIYIEHRINNKLSIASSTPITAENVVKIEKIDQLKQQERDKRCAELKAKRTQQK